MATINGTSASVPKFNITITNDNLHESVETILVQIRPSWINNDCNSDTLHSKVFTGGIANRVIGFYLHDRPDDMILFKIYGCGTDTMVDREKQIEIMILLHKHQLASKLYAIFTNGIAYEYIPGTTLNMKNCHRPEVFSLVAAKMGRFHSVPLREIPTDRGEDTTMPNPLIWDLVDKFITLAAEVLAQHPKLESDFGALGVTAKWAHVGVVELRSIFDSEFPIPVVLAHNDLLLGNIIYDGSSAVSFIDFEYCGPNYAPYDVANHFNEFVGVEPEDMDYDNYPSPELKSEWIRIYLQHVKFRTKKGDAADLSDLSLSSVDQTTFEKWVELCTPLSHLAGILWCVVQTANSKLDFDYVQYAKSKVPQYEKGMKIVRELFRPCQRQPKT